MKRTAISSMLVVVFTLLGVLPVLAQVEIYYVRLGHKGCQDGSETCPYSTVTKALSAGRAQVCVTRTFEIWKWNTSTSKYEYYDTDTGRKPIPGTGVPLPLPLVILIVAAGGAILLLVAWHLRRRSAS